MLYLAIDQHRKQLTVNLRNEQGDVLVKRQVSTEWPRVRSFLEEVREASAPEGGFVAILEVCGFNDWLWSWRSKSVKRRMRRPPCWRRFPVARPMAAWPWPRGSARSSDFRGRRVWRTTGA